MEKIRINNNNIFDFSKVPLRYDISADYQAENQVVYLGEISGTKNIQIKLPDKSTRDNYNWYKVSNISNGGKFYKESNMVVWNDLKSDAELSFEFNYDEDPGSTMGDGGYYHIVCPHLKHTGKVTLKFRAVESVIKDNTLREYILESIGKDKNSSLSKEELKKITNLDLSNKKLESIDGLQYCTNLKSINLSGNNIKDLSQLSNLESLETVNLSGCGISDLGNVINLNNIKNLNLSNNNISDISELNKLTNLKTLDVQDQNINLGRSTSEGNFELVNPIKDINGVAVSNINDISNGGVYDTKSNKILWRNHENNITLNYSFKYNNATNNTIVKFSGKVSKDVTDDMIFTEKSIYNAACEAVLHNYGGGVIKVQDMRKITKLNLSGCNIHSIEDLRFCSSLQELDLSNNEISDISPLRNSNEIQKLNLSNNKISDISSIFIPYSNICLDNNNIFDSSVAFIPQFGYLNYSINNQTVKLKDEDVEFGENISIKLPSNFSKDSIISISDNGIYDENTNSIVWNNMEKDATISFEFNNPKEFNIDFGYCSLKHTGKVTKNVRVVDSVIKDDKLKRSILESLGRDLNTVLSRKELKEITDLDLSGKGIDSIDELQYCTKLKSLNLSGNNIKDINILSDLENLEKVDLSVRVKVLASFTASKIVIKYPYKDSLGQYISSKFFIGIL